LWWMDSWWQAMHDNVLVRLLDRQKLHNIMLFAVVYKHTHPANYYHRSSLFNIKYSSTLHEHILFLSFNYIVNNNCNVTQTANEHAHASTYMHAWYSEGTKPLYMPIYIPINKQNSYIICRAEQPNDRLSQSTTQQARMQRIYCPKWS